MPNKKIGTVTHYYTDLSVGTIELGKDLEIGDRIRFEGHTTDFEQEVESMQYDHKSIEKAKKGQEIGIRVEEKVREGDEVYLVE
jgi:translation elongation factor EF-1alpha